MLCDLQKASDCLNHTILVSKIRFYWYFGVANKFIVSYLQDTNQRVLTTVENTDIFLNGSKWNMGFLSPVPYLAEGLHL
jgi:hypothetical protein